MKPHCFVIAAGGTGGHLFPAQALAGYLTGEGHRVVLMTDKRFASYSAGFGAVEVRTIPSGRMGGGALAKAGAVVNILRGVWAARCHLKELKPAAVVGFGGYPSFPTMQAAQWLGLPTVIHEQNILMGKANRMLAGHVNAIAASFPDMKGLKEEERGKVTLTGNPVRPEVKALSGQEYALPKEGEPFHLLVFGGSQGASIFGTVVPEALGMLPDALRKRVQVTQQCREENLQEVQLEYQALGIAAELHPFIDNMAEKLAEAHLVICRSGASTCAEMTVAGKPAIYVPLPNAAENHQYLNASYLEKHEAGWVMPQDGFTANALSARIESLLTLPQALAKTAERARNLALSGATAKLAGLVMQVAGLPNGDSTTEKEAA